MNVTCDYFTTQTLLLQQRRVRLDIRLLLEKIEGGHQSATQNNVGHSLDFVYCDWKRNSLGCCWCVEW
jgi:hypothetical protein